ncbi:OR7C2 isoform 1 [Pongo abelii]|uniref:OR7C2 isoform 1 n=1 Tax=Pongo abelii TaxID=9601 RepID=A0A2J8T771_PONAB|nr:OR7C2 isoform 1 [Pongo abelii]
MYTMVTLHAEPLHLQPEEQGHEGVTGETPPQGNVSQRGDHCQALMNCSEHNTEARLASFSQYFDFCFYAFF